MAWTLAPALEALRTQVNDLWPNRDKSIDGSIGDEAHRNRVSDHNPDADDVVTAIDITDDDSVGADMRQLAEVLRVSRDPRIKYVIHEGQLFSSYPTSSYPAWTWRPYSGTNGHFSHLHISVTQAGKWQSHDWNLSAFDVREPSTPRRFARLFEFSREEGRAGTGAQQKAIRDVLAHYQAIGERFDRVLFALDQDLNASGRHFLAIQFVADVAPGSATPNTITINKEMDISFLEHIILHELGHVVGWRLFDTVDRTEVWAEEFKSWVLNGAPDGPTWERLKDEV